MNAKFGPAMKTAGAENGMAFIPTITSRQSKNDDMHYVDVCHVSYSHSMTIRNANQCILAIHAFRLLVNIIR